MKGGAAGGCRVGRAAGGDRDRDRDSPGGELGAREATSSVEIVSAVGYGSGGGVPVRTPPPPLGLKQRCGGEVTLCRFQ